MRLTAVQVAPANYYEQRTHSGRSRLTERRQPALYWHGIS